MTVMWMFIIVNESKIKKGKNKLLLYKQMTNKFIRVKRKKEKKDQENFLLTHKYNYTDKSLRPWVK